MFECTAGHTTRHNEKQVLVPTKTRAVSYEHWATDKQGLSVLIRRRGVEVVKEQPFCHEHALSAPPPDGPPMMRSHRFLSRRSYKRLREDYGYE